MTEKVALFGEAQNLVGVVTHPGGDGPGVREVGFVLLNAGVIHRIGPGRLNVKLARRLALAGFPSLRFDLSGLGDSRASNGAQSFEAQAVADIRAAMDHLERARGLRRFVLVGLCSGADNGYATAVADTRVAGLVLLDPMTYPTWKTRPRFLLTGLGQPAWVASVVRRRASRVFGRFTAAFGRERPEPAVSLPSSERYVRPKPPIGEFAAGLASVLDRGGGVIAVYSGSSLRQFSHAGQLDDALAPFGLANRVACRLWADVNHTFIELSAQERLVDTIVEWAGGLRT